MLLPHIIFFQVLMCPPAGCFSRGCMGQRFTEKQPAACGLDLNAPIGTTFVLQFVVYDSQGLNATTQRTLTIISPCDDPTDYICEGKCSKVGSCPALVPCWMPVCAYCPRPTILYNFEFWQMPTNPTTTVIAHPLFDCMMPPHTHALAGGLQYT